MGCKTFENDKVKCLASPGFNFFFDKQSGFTATWGKTKEEDPEYSPFGPMIADIELSTSCTQGCPFCYKSNTPKGTNMSLETFKKIFEKLPKATLTQVAFGIGSIASNPELFDIMQYTRDNGVIPNITINGYRMNSELYNKLSRICGAVAISLYDKDTCYNAVQELTFRGMKQVNIHVLASKETYSKCMQVLQDKLTDPRLSKLNAIVYLALKKVGRGTSSNPITLEQYRNIVNFALENKINIGFDSCSAPYFLEVVKDSPNFDQYEMMAESCESARFSIYISVNSIAYPCSFSTHEINGINMLESNDFGKDVWNNNSLVNFRNKCLSTKHSNGCIKCSLFELGIE